MHFIPQIIQDFRHSFTIRAARLCPSTNLFLQKYLTASFSVWSSLHFYSSSVHLSQNSIACSRAFLSLYTRLFILLLIKRRSTPSTLSGISDFVGLNGKASSVSTKVEYPSVSSTSFKVHSCLSWIASFSRWIHSLFLGRELISEIAKSDFVSVTQSGSVLSVLSGDAVIVFLVCAWVSGLVI